MKKTYALRWLQKQAEDHKHLDSAMDFLRAVGVVPADVEFKGTNWLPSLSLNPLSIRGRYLAEVANDWDKMGPASPTTFAHALSFECAGTEQRDAVAEVLASLGASAAEERAA
jgi:hypothetical protein